MLRIVSLHPAVADRLRRLAPDQRAAATAPPGPTLCVAPAGSGKTTTLVARIAWLVDGGAPPASITAITFNRRAADELRERVDEALAPLGVVSGTVRTRTFHALGREILEEAGVSTERLVDRFTVLSELNGGPIPAARYRRLDDAFSRLKLDPPPPAPARGRPRSADAGDAQRLEIAIQFQRYQRALQDRDALDFDDLVVRAVSELRRSAPSLARWRAAAAHLLVDEVQDLDRTQLRLALLLAGPTPDVFFVGDDDQTIYAWRLADVRRVLDLAARLPGLRRFDLTTNYRCPAPVVTRAVRLVEHNRERFQKQIRSRPHAAGQLVLAPDSGDAVARARAVLSRWPPADGGTAAVLARTNAELAAYAAVAVEAGLAYRAADDGSLLDDPDVDRLLEEAEHAAAETPHLPLLAILGRVRRGAAPAARSVATALLGWAPAYPDVPALRAAVLAARRRRSELRADDARLVLATVHGTKGLEFDHVLCVGLDEGTFPSARTLDEAEDPDRALEEERRLAYVAWTRARRSLVLLYDPAVPSPFLRDAFEARELAPRSTAPAGRAVAPAARAGTRRAVATARGPRVPSEALPRRS